MYPHDPAPGTCRRPRPRRPAPGWRGPGGDPIAPLPEAASPSGRDAVPERADPVELDCDGGPAAGASAGCGAAAVAREGMPQLPDCPAPAVPGRSNGNVEGHGETRAEGPGRGEAGELSATAGAMLRSDLARRTDAVNRLEKCGDSVDAGGR